MVSVDGRPFATATHGVGFKDGMLVKRDIKAPSELLGVAQIPPRILHEIASLPTDLIQLKIDTTGQQTKLLEAQKLQLDAYKALLGAQGGGSAAPATREQ